MAAEISAAAEDENGDNEESNNQYSDVCTEWWIDVKMMKKIAIQAHEWR